MTTENVDYLVIGAGPTGLGACARLQQNGADWKLIDAFDEAGRVLCLFFDVFLLFWVFECLIFWFSYFWELEVCLNFLAWGIVCQFFNVELLSAFGRSECDSLGDLILL